MTGTGSGAPTVSPLPLQWPLIGRHEELELFSATLLDPRAHGFVIHGAAGVGKTRLSDQCLALADRAGRNVARATATEGSRSVPLGALAHLLPPGIANERRDLVTVVSEVRAVLREQMTNGPLVLFVDDLHLLDATSSTLLSQLVDADLVFLVATVRTNESVPVGLESLWHRARVRRVDLDDLGRDSVDTLLHLVLRGPIEARTIADLWSASQGNALFLRELVLGAVDAGHLVTQRGVWRLVGPLVTTRLHELFAARLATLGPSPVDALDILAVWEPIGLSSLEAIVGREQLEMLDHLGWLTVRTDRRRQPVTLAHPLYGEILRARMSMLTRRRLLLEQADRIDAHGARRREDAIRVATARLDASGSADPELLLRAARLARYGQDFTQVERLGRAAMVDGMNVEIGLLIGEALHELRSFDEADEVLRAAESAAAGNELFVQIIEMRCRNLTWGLRRYDEAIEVNRAARRRVSDSADVQELVLNEAMLLTSCGRPRESLDLLEELPPLASPRARAMRAMAELSALVATGRCETAVDAADRAYTEHAELAEAIALPGPGTHLLTKVYGLTECGRFAEATALATSMYDATPATAPPDALMWLAHHLGRCALLSGRAATARRWLTEAWARDEQNRFVGPNRLVLSALATAHAYLGDAPAAAAAIHELDLLPRFPFTDAEQEMGRAWALVADGDLPGGRRVLRAAADLAAASGYRGAEAWLLHDVVRLGDAESVVGRLSELAVVCEGALVVAYAAHAAAAAGRTAQALVDVTDRFEQIGAMLLAAEVANEAAQAFQRVGERRTSTALTVRASTLAGLCEGARTPALRGPVTAVPLTARERDIATLAARGESSKDIADRLFLSVRTVNNHLQSVYSKFGIAGRHELAAALTDLTES